jgi:hypothetical protein
MLNLPIPLQEQIAHNLYIVIRISSSSTAQKLRPNLNTLMKTNPIIPSFLISLGLSASASAAVSLIGVDSTAGPNWRTGAQLETDLEYGTSGYVIFGLNELDAVYNPNYDISSANAGNAYSLPAGISISTADTNIGMWSGNAANFGEIQDPGNGNAITNSPVLANSTGTRQFTISRASSSDYRITLLTASGDNQGTEFTLTVNDGSGAVISGYDHLVNGLAYHVFDISDGTSDIVIDIVSSAENRSITGIGFDTVPVPEPSSALLLSLGILGASLRRRR